MKILIGTIVAIVAASSFALSQNYSKFSVGAGLGLDFGGIGTRVTVQPSGHFGVFGAVGYNLNSLGYNFGAQLKFPSEKNVSAYFTGMYGYNAVLIVDSGSTSKTTYYGPSLGAGLEFRGKARKNFMSLELLLPFRPKVLYDAMDAMKLIGYSVQEPYPIAVSIGYHIAIK